MDSARRYFDSPGSCCSKSTPPFHFSSHARINGMLSYLTEYKGICGICATHLDRQTAERNCLLGFQAQNAEISDRETLSSNDLVLPHAETLGSILALEAILH